jgi:hypothetical protein
LSIDFDEQQDTDAVSFVNSDKAINSEGCRRKLQRGIKGTAAKTVDFSTKVVYFIGGSFAQEIRNFMK